MPTTSEVQSIGQVSEAIQSLRKISPQLQHYSSLEILIGILVHNLHLIGQIANSLSRGSQDDLNALDANANNHAQTRKPPTWNAIIIYPAIIMLLLRVILNLTR